MADAWDLTAQQIDWAKDNLPQADANAVVHTYYRTRALVDIARGRYARAARDLASAVSAIEQVHGESSVRANADRALHAAVLWLIRPTAARADSETVIDSLDGRDDDDRWLRARLAFRLSTERAERRRLRAEAVDSARTLTTARPGQHEFDMRWRSALLGARR